MLVGQLVVFGVFGDRVELNSRVSPIPPTAWFYKLRFPQHSPRLPSNGGMREWGERASLTRPDRKKRPKNKKLRATQQEKVPIGERIDLRRPEKPKCQVCRRRFQTSWRVCPNCGWILPQEKTKRHCIWVQVGHLEAPETKRQMWAEILADAFSKVFSAFRSVNILLTTDNPDAREWGEDFTQVFVLAEDTSVDYLGIPSFSPGKVAKIFAVRLDRICNASYLADLSLNQLSNLIANTIAHEKS